MIKSLVVALRYRGKIAFLFSLILFKIYKYIRYNRISDKKYLSKYFLLAQGYTLNIENPKTFNEKLQWMKIYDRRFISTVLADKYAVRQYIANIFGSEYLIPLLGSYRNPSKIDINSLPTEPFIIKPSHSSGDFVIVRDKTKLNLKSLIVDCNWWLSFNYYYPGRQWQYKHIKPRIIIEKLLLTNEGKLPNDFKFHCINGKVEFIYVSVDREGINVRHIYDLDWKRLPFSLESIGKKKYKKSSIVDFDILPPLNFQKMVTFAEKVAELYSYVRVDFYEVNDKLYFGEITHHHGGGFDQLRPIEWDYKYGDLLNLDYVSL